MKDKRNKRIKILANKIAQIEEQIALGNNVQENQNKIQNITDSLTLEEILQVDEYITRKKIIDKIKNF